jgi:AraC-like DNA-binding protein
VLGVELETGRDSKGADGSPWHVVDPAILAHSFHVGYADTTAFRRAFEKATGLSPGGYRDAYGLAARPGSRRRSRFRVSCERR